MAGGKKKNTRQKAAKSRLGSELIPGSGRPSNPAQITTKLWCNMVNFVFPVVSGACATVASIAPSGIVFSSSLQNLWDEFRVLQCEVDLYATTATNGTTPTRGGIMKFYWDDNDTSAPTALSANSKRGAIINISAQSPNSHIKIHWQAEDLDDLAYSPMSSPSVSPVCLKAYCDTSEYGTNSADSTSQVIGIPKVLVEFRGLGGGA